MPSVLRERNFFLFFIANTLSVLGSAVTTIALPLTAVQALSANAQQMGVLIACQLLPFVLLCIPAGVWIDRSDKRIISIIFDVFAAVGLLAVPLAWYFNALSMPLLYVAAFLVKTQEAVGGSAQQVLLTLLVGRERLVEANSKLSGAASAAQIAGPALAAAVIALLGAPAALLADAASFIVSACLLATVRVRELLQPSKQDWLADIREGFVLVWQTPILRHLVWVVFGWISLNDGFIALYVLHAARDLGFSAGQVAVMNTLGAIGGLFGAWWAQQHKSDMRRGMVLGIVCAALGYALYGLETEQWAYLATQPVWAKGVSLMLVDAGAAIYVVNYLSLRQAVTPNALLGRMVTTMRFLSILFTPLMTLWIGWSGDRFGLVAVFIGLGFAGAILAALAAWRLPSYQMRMMA